MYVIKQKSCTGKILVELECKEYYRKLAYVYFDIVSPDVRLARFEN